MRHHFRYSFKIIVKIEKEGLTKLVMESIEKIEDYLKRKPKLQRRFPSFQASIIVCIRFTLVFILHNLFTLSLNSMNNWGSAIPDLIGV